MQKLNVSLLALLALSFACTPSDSDTGDIVVVSEGNRLTLAVNERLQLSARKADGDGFIPTELTWTSSDPTKAKVDEWGLVRGVGSGTVNIKVSHGTGTGSLELKVEGAIHEGLVEVSETWRAIDNPHRVLGDGVDYGAGAKLVIEAGVEVFFERNTRLLIGDGDGAELEVRGTEEAPVKFLSAQSSPAPGDYGGLVVIEDGRATIDHLIVSHGGGESRTDAEGAIQVRGDSNRPTFRHVTIRESGSVGLALLFGSAFSSSSSDITFEKSRTHALAFSDADSVGSTPTSLNFDEGDTVLIEGGALTRTQTWPALSAPYLIPEAMIYVGGEARPVLSIAAGTEIRFGVGAGFHAGESETGNIHLLGSEEAPILLTSMSESPKAGDWTGLFFDDNANNSRVEWTTIRYAGGESHSSITPAALVVVNDRKGGFIENTALEDSDASGITQVCVEIDPDDCSYTDFTLPLYGNSFTRIRDVNQHNE